MALRYHKHINAMIFRRDARAASTKKVEKVCYFLYGDAGTGKTQDVLNYVYPEQLGFTRDDVFILQKGNSGNVWWNGYNNHRVLLIDDMEPGMIPRQNLLNILDDLSFKGETKGDVIQTSFEFVFITSNYHPHEVLTKMERWTEYDQYENPIRKKAEVVDPALLSRFDHIIDYSGCENLRLKRKQTKWTKKKDAKSVASLLPATLEFGTNGDKGQCGSVRVPPSPNSRPKPKQAKSLRVKKLPNQTQASTQNFGTNLEDFGTIDAKDEEE